MINLQYMREDCVAELKAAIEANTQLYRGPASFVGDFFKDRKDWVCESSVKNVELPILVNGDDGESEATNSIALHKALIGITESQASDERLWVWLAHGPYWNYMRGRWPSDSTRSKESLPYILEHYFFGGNVRNLVRQGISRLWWFAHTTHDPLRSNPYELTTILLRHSDNRQQVMERAFSRNRDLVRGLLTALVEMRDNGNDLLGSRTIFRGLCREINLWGGTLALDFMNRDDIRALVEGYLQRVSR